MATDIFIAKSDAEIEFCFPVIHALRPHIEEGDFLSQVRRQQEQSYQILALRHEGMVKSVAGFRFAEFLAWGKILYIDDLSTLPGERSKGFASSLLDWLFEHAKANNCQAVHLDTGYMRHTAHRLYLKKGLKLHGHHMSLEFETYA
jgi:GNAT superfamily N-acetyltransferase